MAAVLIGGVFLFLACAVPLSLLPKPVESSRHSFSVPISSLRMASEINGRFALGSGLLRTTPTYFCYIKEDGGLLLDDFPAADTILIESETDTPVAMWDDIDYKSPSWAVPSWLSVTRTKRSKYKLVVPKGTVILDYKAN
jgi:hypothetical protein